MWGELFGDLFKEFRHMKGVRKKRDEKRRLIAERRERQLLWTTDREEVWNFEWGYFFQIQMYKARDDEAVTTSSAGSLHYVALNNIYCSGD